MTFDLHMTFDPVIVVKNGISMKTPLLLQTTCNGDKGRSCYLTLVGVYGVFTDRGSKVIKGVISGFGQKTSRIFFPRTKHRRIF